MRSWCTCLVLLFAWLATADSRPNRISKKRVSQTVYQDLAHYATYVQFATFIAGGHCPDPKGAVVEHVFNISATGTQTTLFRDDERQELILSFPGAHTLQDFLTDAMMVQVAFRNGGKKCSGCKAHWGFAAAWNSVAPDIAKQLQIFAKKYSKYSIKIVGGSLGGAIAQLAYAQLKLKNKHRINGVYTYGQPRVGNAQFANFIDRISGALRPDGGEYHRVTHYNDGVPQVPPISAGYHHSRTEYWEAQRDPSWKTTYQCFGQEPLDCSRTKGNGLNYIEGKDYAHYSYAGYGDAKCII